MSPDPQSAAMQLAIDPSLISLDQAISAIRYAQMQADQTINTLLDEIDALTKENEQLRAGVPGRDAQSSPTASENRS